MCPGVSTETREIYLNRDSGNEKIVLFDQVYDVQPDRFSPFLMHHIWLVESHVLLASDFDQN